MDGFVLVDKPAGMSSQAVVHATRRALGLPGGRRGAKVGHAGTLDPFATGLVVVLVGAATRLMRHVVGHDKRYLLEVTFGATSTTDDVAGELQVVEVARPNEDAVREAVMALAASTEQVPPSVSALHVDGERAYRRVRRGEQLDLPARPIALHAVEIVEVSADDAGEVMSVALDVRCGSGTYMRSIARDLGAMLGCGGYASALRRLEVGRWSIDAALAPDIATAGDVHLPVGLVAELPMREVDEAGAVALTRGQRIAIGELAHPAPRDVAAVLNGGLVAVCEERAGRDDASVAVLHPRTVVLRADAVLGQVTA